MSKKDGFASMDQQKVKSFLIGATQHFNFTGSTKQIINNLPVCEKMTQKPTFRRNKKEYEEYLEGRYKGDDSYRAEPD